MFNTKFIIFNAKFIILNSKTHVERQLFYYKIRIFQQEIRIPNRKSGYFSIENEPPTPKAPYHSPVIKTMMTFVFKTSNCVLKTRNCVSKTRNCVLKTRNCVETMAIYQRGVAPSIQQCADAIDAPPSACAVECSPTGLQSQNNRRFFNINHHFSGAILHFLCIFNRKLPQTTVGIYIAIRTWSPASICSSGRTRISSSPSCVSQRRLCVQRGPSAKAANIII